MGHIIIMTCWSMWSRKKKDRFSNYSINPRVYYAINDSHILDFSYVFENYEKRYVYTTSLPSKKVLEI